MNYREVIYHPRAEATSEAEISALAGVYSYLINTHFSKKTVECAAAFGDRDSSITIRTQCKEAPSDLSDPECDAEGDGTEQTGEDNMALFTAEDYEPLPPGLYVGKLLDIESRESTNGEYRRWSWEILEGSHAGSKVYANTSTNFGPQAKARQWVENILGRELEGGEQVGAEDLVGEKHHLMVENVKRDGRTFDSVSAVHSYRE